MAAIYRAFGDAMVQRAQDTDDVPLADSFYYQASMKYQTSLQLQPDHPRRYNNALLQWGRALERQIHKQAEDDASLRATLAEPTMADVMEDACASAHNLAPLDDLRSTTTHHKDVMEELKAASKLLVTEKQHWSREPARREVPGSKYSRRQTEIET